MKRMRVIFIAVFVLSALVEPPANAYLADTTVAQGGGCPQLNRWNLSVASPLNRRWSTALPSAPQTILTVASAGSNAQLLEIGGVISDSFGVWTGVSGTTFNAANYPGLIGPLNQVSTANSCSDDQGDNVDGLNTICFDQASDGFTSGVLAFTRVITADAPGVSMGASASAAFAGQILDADTLFRNDGQATFATPGALSTTGGEGAYDLESLLTHELGHWRGFDHSAVWRAIMFPFAPPPGQYLGNRPTPQVPDGPLADDDRTGIRVLYPDPNDSVDIGEIRGRVLPANPFSLALLPSPSPGSYVTGIFGAQVVAVDARTGAVIAGAIAGWSCNGASPPLQFDGSYDLARLPVGQSYILYAEPLSGLAGPGDFSVAFDDLCGSNAAPACTTPAANTDFNPRMLPAVQ